MKKILIVLSLLAFIFIVSCKKSNVNQILNCDSTQVDTVECDSVQIDTAKCDTVVIQ